MSLFTARSRISHKCLIHDKSVDFWRPLKSLNTIQLQEVVHNHSTMRPRIVVLKDCILAHLTEIWYNMRSENFVNVPSAIQVPRHNDKGSSSIKTNTCPYNTSTVVCRCWLDSRFQVSLPVRRHTRMRPSTFRRQNMDSSEESTRDQCCRLHLPYHTQNWHIRAL